jgi:hypothetical protein
MFIPVNATNIIATSDIFTSVCHNPILELHPIIEFAKVIMNSNHEMEKNIISMLNPRIAELLVLGSCQFNISKFCKFISKSCSSFLHYPITRKYMLFVHLFL